MEEGIDIDRLRDIRFRLDAVGVQENIRSVRCSSEHVVKVTTVSDTEIELKWEPYVHISGGDYRLIRMS